MKLIKLVAIVFCLLITSDLSQAQLPNLGNLLGGGNNSGGALGNLLGGGNNSGGALGNLLGGGNNSGGALGNLLGGGNSNNNTGGGGLGSHINQALNIYRGASGQQNQSQGALGSLQKLQGLQGLLPALNGGGQNNANTGTDLLSRLNQSSKSLVDRTTGWARQKKQEMGQKMLGNTLGNLVPGLNQQQPSQTKSAFDWLKPKTLQAPTQPPLRSAQNYGQQPGIRY